MCATRVRVRPWGIYICDETSRLVAGPFEGHTDHVYSVAFSPDGKHVVSGSGDKTIRIWDVQTGRVIASPFEGDTDRVYSIAFSPDGKRVASGSHDGTIRIGDAEARCIDSIGDARIHSMSLVVAFSSLPVDRYNFIYDSPIIYCFSTFCALRWEHVDSYI